MRTLFFSLAILAFCSSVYPQNAPLPCEGRRATVRVSEITSGGSARGFMDAVAAHKAWVFSHGLTKDEITTVPVIVRDDKSKVRSYSDRQFWSIHIHGSNGPDPKHDEAYDAFVKMYRDNSDIKSTYDVCLPNNSLK
jgi:hypothetical protein